jgi:hypothetical protein
MDHREVSFRSADNSLREIPPRPCSYRCGDFDLPRGEAMQWLFNIGGPDWLMALRQSRWIARVQVLLSAGLGMTGIISYFAGEGLRRLSPPNWSRRNDGSR